MPEKPQISIRRATLAHADAILSCLASAFACHRSLYTPAAYQDTVLTPESIQHRMHSMTVFVAVAGSGEIVGTIACQAVSPEEGHLRGMAVLPEWQGGGIAVQLLRAAEAELRGRNCKRITLDTTEPLQRAMHFYEKNGYRRSGKVSDFFGMPLFEYVKTVKP